MPSLNESASAQPSATAGLAGSQPASEPISFSAQLAYELGQVGAWRENPLAETASGNIKAEEAISKAHQMGLVGLAFSGGGIRSATFNLGILQALAALKLLEPIDYLSTVSGGGYIGAWFSNLVYLKKQAALKDPKQAGVEDPVESVRELLASVSHEQASGKGVNPSEPPEVTWLRRYSNYLTPRTGLLSLDTLQGAATYFRNVLLNQTILIALLCLGLLIPWVVAILWGWVFALDGLLWSTLLAAAGAILIGAATFCLARRSPLILNSCRGDFPNGRTPLGIAGLYLAGSALLAGAIPAIWHGRRQWIAELPFIPSFDEPAATTALAVGLISVGCMIAYAFVWLVGWTSDPRRLAEAKLSRRRTSVVSLLSAMVAGLVFGLLLSAYGSLFETWSDDLSPGVASVHATVLGTAAVGLAVLLTLTLQLGLAGADFPDILREWWGRLGGLILQWNLYWLALAIAAIYSPYGVIVVKHWGAHWLMAGGAVWLATTIGGVLSGASPRTGLVKEGKAPWFDPVAKAAPYVFCAGLMILISYGLYYLGDVALGPHSAICTPPDSLESASAIPTGDRTVKHPVYEIYQGAEAGRAGGSPTEVISEVRPANFCSFTTYAENFHLTFPRPALAPAGLLLVLVAILKLLLALLGRRVDVNQFSLHMFYRNRLERCYLGAGQVGQAFGKGGINAARSTSDDFTNLDPSASPALAFLRQRPYPIINTALNAAHSNNLAWQERKAASFTFTPKYCGYEYADETGSRVSAYRSTLDYGKYRSTSDYAKKATPLCPREALPLAMPITISGAAASPNGGFHTSPGTAFLMTMFNVRLGWWFANPLIEDKDKGKENWEVIGPKSGFLSLLSELLASSRDDLPQVYLSDGGHFENLGLYELVRRRCRYIIVCDADADPKFEFEDIGNAIRKIRIDFGIDIEIDTRSLVPDPQTGRSLFHCAVGKIHYGNVDRNANGLRELHGYLLYIKPSLTGVEPGDVLQYAAANKDFPHQTTLDQWFTESQFEAYRELGRHIGETVFKRDWDWLQRCPHDPEAEKSSSPSTLDEKIERLAVLLTKRWYTPSASVRSAFSKHGEAMNELFGRLSQDEDLKFLDGQFYPQWPDLTKEKDKTSPPTKTAPLPTDPKEFRKGFYFCNQIFQLMENVYVDLNLEAESDHPDNRGWMNIFHNWAWSPMLRVAWAMSAASYGARFQTFCERKLGLRVGRVVLDEKPEGGTPPLNSEERAILAKLHDSLEKLKLIASGDSFEVVPLRLCVDNPLEEGASIFNCGFGFALIKNPKTLVFYRVQDHLRTVGLGTEGLRKLRVKYPGLELDAAVMQKIREVLTEELRKLQEKYPGLELDVTVMQKIREVFTDKGVEQMRAIWGASASPKRRAQGM